MKEKISVIKIGGNIIANSEKLTAFLANFAQLKGKKVLIHGGGKLATEISEKIGVPFKMIDGRRITDKATLDVVTMVYAGLTNKTIVAILQQNNCNALGLTGADANMIKAHKRPVKEIDYGFVGDIEHVNQKMLKTLLETNITPVFCSITHNKEGQLLNTNADTIASEIAKAVSSYYDTTLYYCFEKKGVLRNINDENSVITHITTSSYENFVKEGIIVDGMLPKLHNCFYALNNGVQKVCIGNEKMIVDQSEDFTHLSL